MKSNGTPFIARDESYILFSSFFTLDGKEVYFRFREKYGSWSKPVNLGPTINSKWMDKCPKISPYGKYLFFSSNRRLYKLYSEIPLTYEDKLKILNSPGNGSSDIYWMEAKIIEELKPKKIK